MPHFGASNASRKVVEKLEEHGYEAVFVGGAVRDHLLGKYAADVDIATAAEPAEVKAIFKNTIDVGIEHGTILVLMDEEPIEVTTYRSENKSLADDLLHRDFTINALVYTKDGELLDLFGGQSDLHTATIRAVGIPQERFEEDPLRMMRAVRFASVLDFTIEPTTFEAIQVYSKALESVSIERIKIEFDKLFQGENPRKGLQLLITSGLAKALPLFPRQLTDHESLYAFASTEEGWATLMIEGGFTAAAMGSVYKLSNDEKRFLQWVQKAYDIRQRREFQIDEFYFLEQPILLCAEKIYCAKRAEPTDGTRAYFLEQKALLPIQSKADLVVNGQDLLAWADQKGGRWVGEWMSKMEYAVLHGQLKNHRDTIKEWFINDFDNER